MADIAQKLADHGALSKTLSDLLSEAYGFGDKLEEHKRALAKLIDERKAMQQAEEDLIAEIDRLEQKSIEDNATLRPQIMKRIDVLTERMTKINHEIQHGYLPPNEKIRKLDMFDEVKRLLAAAREELEALE